MSLSKQSSIQKIARLCRQIAKHAADIEPHKIKLLLEVLEDVAHELPLAEPPQLNLKPALNHKKLPPQKHYLTWTDGGCSPNPGQGGWAFIIKLDDGHYIEKYGAEENSTNNRMELRAVIELLKAFPKQANVTVHTDSNYTKQGISTWINRWRMNGWKTADGKPVKNDDLWRELDRINSSLNVEWKWVKGHSQDPHNDRCDELATLARQSL